MSQPNQDKKGTTIAATEFTEKGDLTISVTSVNSVAENNLFKLCLARFGAAITIGFLLCLSATAFAQDEIDVGERIYLRELTRVSAATKIVSRPGAKLPAKNPIRLFLALGLDFETQSRFTRWLEDWNAKRGAKFGRVEIVSKSEEADVILARFIDTEFTVTKTVMVPWAKSPVSPNIQKRYAPVYSYVLRPAEGRLNVLWRNAAQIDLDMTSRHSNRAGWELRDAIFSLLRKRS